MYFLIFTHLAGDIDGTGSSCSSDGSNSSNGGDNGNKDAKVSGSSNC